MTNQWTNSDGISFEIHPVRPFLEDEIRASFEIPRQPYYKVEQFGPNGETFEAYYPYTDDTMTEPSPDPKNDPDLITNLPSPDGKLRRWVADTTPLERRAWVGYKTALIQMENEINQACIKQMLCQGCCVKPDEAWLEKHVERSGDPVEAKYHYILQEVCQAETDLQSLLLAIQNLRAISKERVMIFENAFRGQSQPDSTEATE